MFNYFKNIIHNSNPKHRIPRNIYNKEHEELKLIKLYKATENMKEDMS